MIRYDPSRLESALLAAYRASRKRPAYVVKSGRGFIVFPTPPGVPAIKVEREKHGDLQDSQGEIGVYALSGQKGRRVPQRPQARGGTGKSTESH